MKKKLFIIAILCLSLLVYGCSNNPENIVENTNDTKLMAEDVNTFTTTGKNYDDNGYGKVRVKGYAIVKEISACIDDDPCEDNTSKYNRVYFNVLETKSDAFLNFLDYWKINTNSPTDKPTVILGCLSNGKISYVNASDSSGMKDFTLDKEITNKIINSTEENPVILDLERLELTTGSGAPICYSHITHVNVAN